MLIYDRYHSEETISFPTSITFYYNSHKRKVIRDNRDIVFWELNTSLPTILISVEAAGVNLFRIFFINDCRNLHIRMLNRLSSANYCEVSQKDYEIKDNNDRSSYWKR